jgi:hypothetical protein
MECFKIDDPDKRELAMMLLKKDYIISKKNLSFAEKG